MGETLFFVTSGLAVTIVSAVLFRLGYRHGGVDFALAWWALFLSAGFVALSDRWPPAEYIVPVCETAFPFFLLTGSLYMTRRVEPPFWPIWCVAAVVALARSLAAPALSDLASQVTDVGVVTLCVLIASTVMLTPPGRRPTAFERAIAFSLPAVPLAAAYYTWLVANDLPRVPGFYAYLLAANGIGVIQIAAYVGRTARRIDRLAADASRSREAMALVEERYRKITEQSSDMITEIDLNGTILYANAAHETILGLKPAMLVGRSVDFVFPRQADEGGYEKTDMPSTASHRRYVTATDRDGNKHYLECEVARFRLDDLEDPEVAEERLVVTSRDVTQRVLEAKRRDAGQQELRELVEARTVALDTSLERLRRSERLASMGTLSAGIAHQINNPIGSIRLGAEYALTVAEEGDEDVRKTVLDSLHEIVEHAKRCGEIVSNMLRFARNEPTPKQREDLSAILIRVCKQSEAFARTEAAAIDTSGVEGPLPIYGSAIELEQAFLNVVRNACESSNGPVHVEVRARNDRGAIWVAISDDGRGMSREQVDHALEPFWTTRLGSGGTGLGLSVAHGVVTDHGGLLSIESQPEKGTKVLISLPEFEEAAALA